MKMLSQNDDKAIALSMGTKDLINRAFTLCTELHLTPRNAVQLLMNAAAGCLIVLNDKEDDAVIEKIFMGSMTAMMKTLQYASIITNVQWGTRDEDGKETLMPVVPPDLH